MTDKQLAFLLRQLTSRLRDEVNKVNAGLGETPFQPTRTRGNFFGGTTISYPILDGLYEIVEEMDKSISLLEVTNPNG